MDNFLNNNKKALPQMEATMELGKKLTIYRNRYILVSLWS